MAVTSQVERLRALAAPAAESAGLVLEEVTVTPVGRRRLLRITVDLPEDVRGGVPVEAVASASHAISQALDAHDVMGQTPYVLEVSSPGVDRPLVERRHWKRARGRLVTVRLAGADPVRGRLTEAGEGGPVVDGRTLPWPEVVDGRVEVEFGRLPEDEADDGQNEQNEQDDQNHEDEAEGSA